MSLPPTDGSATPAASPPAVRRRVIIDTDGGSDDAVALLLALRSPDVEVVAVTTVFGNVTVEQAAENVFTILRVFGASHIPFFAGSPAPLVGEFAVDRWPGHGSNGLGDASFIDTAAGEHHHAAYQQRVQAAVGRKHAVQALIDLSAQYPGELDLIALGPLTNLALAARMDPSCPARFRSLTLMGGSCFGRGNSSLLGEFNLHCDPEGAHIALAAFASRIPALCVPWEATEECALSWQEFDELALGYEEHIEGDDNTKHRLEASFLKKTHAKYELFVRYGGDAKLAAEAQAATAAGVSTATASVRNNGVTASTAPTPASIGSTVSSDQADALNEIASIDQLPSGDASPPSAAAAAEASAEKSSASAALASALEPPFAPVARASSSVSSRGYVCCDSFAVACLLRPSIIAASVRHHTEVVYQGCTEVTRGGMAIDWYDRRVGTKGEAPVTTVTHIDKSKYLDMMREIFQPQAVRAAAAGPNKVALGSSS